MTQLFGAPVQKVNRNHIKLSIENPIYLKTNLFAARLLAPLLSFPAEFYQEGPFGKKIRKEYEKSTIVKDTKEGCAYIYTGFLERIKKWCLEQNIDLELEGSMSEFFLPYTKPSLPNITLREDQVKQIMFALQKQRGIIKAPTGIGKTVVGLAIISAFPGKKILWLCHTKDLMYQTVEELKKQEFKEIGIVGDGKFELDKQIVVATRQSFIKVPYEDYDAFDGVIIDEVHHLSELKGSYASILSNLFCPVRLGLTATLSDKAEGKMISEALLGPVIDEITVEEGQDLGLLSQIRIKFLKVSHSYKIKDLRKYPDVYSYGVVHRKEQHEIIVSTAKKHVERNESVLIIVTQIAHGQNILQECEEQGILAHFVQGATEGETRVKLKNALNDKKVLCLIATTIFREGINIPELNVIINAAGGRSEILTLQTIGRGLRITERKKRLIFYDLVDTSHRYLIEPLGERLALYTEMGWLN